MSTQMFRITSLTLENIGPFGKLSLDFPEKPEGMKQKAEIHIFTGENGTGKTTILEVLVGSCNLGVFNSLLSKFRFQGVLKELHPFFVAEPDLNFNNPPVKFKVGYNSNEVFACSRGRDGSFTISSTSKFVENYHQHPNQAARKIAFFAYSGYRKLSHIEGIEPKSTEDDPMARSLDFSDSTDPRRLLQWITNNLSKKALAKQNNSDFGKYEKALLNIQDAVLKIIGKKISFALDYDPFKVVIEVDNEYLDFNQLPDGLRSFLSWLADLLMRMDRMKWENDIPVFERNFILFLDEIEVHMHPAWQRKILPAVQELFPNAQIFVSTHSPFVIGSIDGAWIHKFEKPNGNSHLAEGYPMLSEDAKSYDYWLDEVFGIRDRFGLGVTNDMKTFYDLRNRLLKGENGTVPEKLLSIGRELAKQSLEVNQIIQMEIRQINRQTGLELKI